MNPTRFDAVTRMFAERRLSRRTAVGTSLAAGIATVTGIGTAAAQVATPVAVAVADHEPTTTQLFVQSFRSGSLAPSTSAFGTHTVTLAQGMGQTIVFNDRPSREVGTSPTPAFLDGLGFTADNPPNAAMVIDAGDGTTDIAVIELFNPSYDEATHTATYDIAVLANWQNDLALGFQEEPSDLANVASQFGATHLFIDGCGGSYECVRVKEGGGGGESAGWLSYVSATYWWDQGSCVPDGTADTRDLESVNAYWDSTCNDTFSYCEGRCFLWYPSRDYQYP